MTPREKLSHELYRAQVIAKYHGQNIEMFSILNIKQALSEIQHHLNNANSICNELITQDGLCLNTDLKPKDPKAGSATKKQGFPHESE